VFRSWAIIASSLLVLATPGLQNVVGSASSVPFPATPRPPQQDGARTIGGVGGLCGENALLDDAVCVTLDEEGGEHPMAILVSNAHVEKRNRYRVYDQIPKRAERPANYDAYRYPIPPGIPGGHYVVSGYDLDLPDQSQRRGPRLSHTGHGGLDLPQARGTPVHIGPLEHQTIEAEVLYAGPLFGTSVVTLHTVREAGQTRDYVVIFGHLDGIAAGIAAGRHVMDGEVIGFVGDTGSPELVHLHLEIRRVRESTDLREAVRKGGGGAILLDYATVVTDPRNLLPLAN
jgi:murein DD-endopeptidase MepM/ murein hydrolase activator NlpD